MYADLILSDFKLPRAQPYTPRFKIRREERGWRLFDGGRAIAFFMPTALDIWAFSPFERDILANREPPGKVWDLYTLHNTYVNLGAHGWPQHWREQAAESAGCVKWTWARKAGARLEAQATASFRDGEHLVWRLSVSYEPAWGRYRYSIAIAARALQPDGFEPLNMMLAGALTSRPEDRRWTHSVWEGPDGQLRRIVHSNALFTCTDYSSALWRTRNAPFRGAWMGYAAHKIFNPAIVIHDTNVPIRFATCSQLFDEHVIWADNGQENIGADGYFHFRMDTELVNMKAARARRLLAAAADPAAPTRWQREAIAVPFHMDRVNSFEETVDSWQAEECPIIELPRAGEAGGVQWASDAAHSGRRSIRLQAGGWSERRELFPTGAVCNVKPGRRYRLTGWVRTRGVKRFARLELASYEYAYANVIDTLPSASVIGSRKWTRVSVELDSGDEAYLMPKLVLYGPGTAWFDDIALEEVGR